jgi:hypothetical protein
VARPALEVADLLRIVIRQGRLGRLSSAQLKVVKALTTCRTAALGGHVDVCDACGHEEISYNSCRDRHCPKCQAAATAAWLESQQAQLLPVPYAHVVFTLPSQLAPLALQNPRVVYALLFRAVSETLLQVAATPRHLGARIGFLAVLHTWGQTLVHHPHVHCVVPAGGLAPDGSRWIGCRPGFFLPVRVLGRLYRGKLLALLRAAHAAGRLEFHGELERLRGREAFGRLLDEVRVLEWVVYAKPPFGGPAAVLKYLARYTHRVAISNRRLVEADDDQVSFAWKDYRHGHRRRVMTLDSAEFARRFLLHVLPQRFVKIRYYGLLAQSRRGVDLPRCRELLGTAAIPPDPTSEPRSEHDAGTEAGPDSTPVCPTCRNGRLVHLRTLRPFDSS